MSVARFFIAVDRVFGLMVQGLAAIYQGIWLGLLDRSTLQEIAIRQYDRWEKYQSDDHNLAGLFAWEKAIIDRYFGDCCSILVGASGGGREVIALAQRGKDMTAFECQPTLVSASQRLLDSQNIQAQIMLTKPDHVPEEAGMYDGLILGWGAYIHIAGHDARITFLRQFRKHVRPGGPILLSFFVRKTESRKLRWVSTIANMLHRLRRSKELIEIGDTLDGTFDHYFSEEEIRAELDAAGFEVVFFTDTPFGHAVGRAV